MVASHSDYKHVNHLLYTTMDVSYHCRIVHPARIVISGASYSGKSELIKHMIINHKDLFESSPLKIYMFYLHGQSSYKELERQVTIPMVFIKGAPGEDFLPEEKSLIVFDDLMNESMVEIESWFVRKAHHYKCDVIHVTQNLFPKNMRTISLNANYLIVFRNLRDASQMEVGPRRA